jgi:hypothetical protein
MKEHTTSQESQVFLQYAICHVIFYNVDFSGCLYALPLNELNVYVESIL